MTDHTLRWEEPTSKSRKVLTLSTKRLDAKGSQLARLIEWGKNETPLAIKTNTSTFARVYIVEVDVYTITVTDPTGRLTLLYKNNICSIAEIQMSPEEEKDDE